MKLVETETATVKMTVGKPFTAGGGNFSSSEESDDEQAPQNSKNNELNSTVESSKHNGDQRKSASGIQNSKCKAQDSQTNCGEHKTKVFTDDTENELVNRNQGMDSAHTIQQKVCNKGVAVLESMRNKDDFDSEQGNGSKCVNGVSDSEEMFSPEKNHSVSQTHRPLVSIFLQVQVLVPVIIYVSRPI